MALDAEVRRELDGLKQGATFATGEFTLAANPATSTVVAKRGVSSSSVIHPQGFSTLAVNSDITHIVPGKDTFTVFHTASVNTRTYRFSFVTPVG